MIKVLFEKFEEIRNEEMIKFLKRVSDDIGIDTSQLYFGCDKFH